MPHIHVFVILLTFLPYQFKKKIRILKIRFLFGMSPELIVIRANQLITKWWAKCKLLSLILICTDTNAKFIVICKPRTLNDGGEYWDEYT